VNRRNAEAARARGDVASGGLPHGFMLMRLWYLRGFENLMLDIATDEPRLQTLIDLIVEHARVVVDQWLRIGVDMMSFPEDLGTQTSSIISPARFHQWITPAYSKLVEPCHAAGVLVHQHSDGHVIELMDEFVEAGRDVINLQDLVNGIDDIAAVLKGRVCIDLDIDRQKIVPFGTRQEIHDLIEEEVRKLGSPQGGLIFTCGIYPPTPPENIDAVCSALGEFRTYWW
jgi:uroporphyrinogen-III decarboxylase